MGFIYLHKDFPSESEGYCVSEGHHVLVSNWVLMMTPLACLTTSKS